jgi:hypothetical protein
VKDVPINFRFSPQLELDILKGTAPDPDRVGLYATHHQCPRCGWFVPLTFEGKAAVVRCGLTLHASEVVGGRLHFTLGFQRPGVIFVADCGHCGLDGMGIHVSQGGAGVRHTIPDI